MSATSIDTKISDRILNLETELASIKEITKNNPDFTIDEINWSKVKLMTKKIRQKLFQKVYGTK